ncbi:DUF748 domain-containing protein [Ideonella sp.]|uniref:DUF748 domain-containing protein n=1 Tax=Ideonella sp. TaxID=1929293 RepID=UPI002B474847|nr:DUF748 domain-containing protein [Ideonella sp.]HJV70783.1 DUF748 domain-containing protein [Ideonella sp.]
MPMPLAPLTRGRRVLLALALLVVALLLLAWLVLPLWLRGFAERQASVLLGRAVTIAAVQVNPLRLQVGVDGLVVAGPASGSRPLLRLAHGEVNADLRSLWRGAPVIEAAELRAPEVSFSRLSDGRYDIDDVLARLRPTQPAPADSPPPRFALYNLRIVDGQVRFDDRPKARVHEVRGLQLGLPFLSNLDDAVDVLVRPHLAFQLDDTAFDTGAQATPFAPERAGSLTLKTGDIDLADWLPYVPAGLPLRPVAGTLALDLALQFKAPPGAAPEVGLKGGLRAKAVRLVDAADATCAELAGLSLQAIEAQPLRRHVAVGLVQFDGLDLRVRRDTQSRINWVQAFASPAPGSEAAPTAAAQAPWQLDLSRLILQNSRLQWQDEAVRPAAQVAIEDLQLRLDRLRWPLAEGGEPARLSARARLAQPGVTPVAAAGSAPGLQLDGEWTAAGGTLQARGNAWPLGWAGAYLSPMLKPRIEGRLGFDATARWQGEPGVQLPTVELTEVQIDDFQATAPGERLAGAGWKQLRVAEATLDAVQRQVTLGHVSWDRPSIRARRDAAGRIDLLGWWIASAAQPAAPAREAGAPWQLRLQQASVDGGRVVWQDAAAGGPEPVALDVQRLQLGLRDLQWPGAPRSTAQLQGSAMVTTPGDKSAAGRLSWQGKLGLAPWAWRGQARVEHFPLHAVAPYGAGALPVTIAHADAGWAGQVGATLADAGLSLTMKGGARVTDLRLYPRLAPDAGRGDELLSWQALELPGVQVTIAPGQRARVELGEARLADFYARLSVNEAGHFNLADLNAAPAAGGAAASAAPAAAASAASAAEPALDLSIAGLQLANGSVDFSDHFIRPNYSAALSELNGRVGAFRTGTREMAAIELRGRVAGTGQLEIRGALNPMAKPLALDVQARASELELAPLSPYAGKYAGYAIERGKLSMDVSYRIDADGRLEAKNQIVLNQLTFGDRIDSPDATKLPVLLAVALLKDRNGVIDLNLPIGGSLNDPQFSIGGVVVKLIVNLLTKALTAPFALLAGGGSEDLSLLEFEPGTARLADRAAPVLDKVARSLTERPGLQMTVTGVADPQTEREAMQAAWLDERLVAELRKERLRAGVAPEAAASAPTSFSVDDRARLVRRIYADSKLPNKPRNVIGLAKDIPVPEMEALLRASFVVNADNARELALQRGLAVRDALIAKGLPSERLFLAAPKLRAAGEGEAAWTPRVQLSLATH